MYKDVGRIVEQCQICGKYGRCPTNLQKIRLPLNNPLHKIGIDHVGPLPKTHSGNRYIVIATDYVTRWCEAAPIKTKSAAVIAKFLIERIFMQHGPSKELLSDQGCEFTNKMWHYTQEGDQNLEISPLCSPLNQT
ncbi:Retrovirus-related Pol polyprotein from transposon [Nosema granulosis]|uniref:Retrovirus-related Pol polyprotein from transposon n=1 Tax=Nosema granulosis TaxID=83296 RepID=A0A9P6KXY0_9MICR|nr:Retrovirus-related Pol polyprotein from transposon [Nosema granulosis]